MSIILHKSVVKKSHLKMAVLGIMMLNLAFSGASVFASGPVVLRGGGPKVLVCDVLESLGLGCGSSSIQSGNSSPNSSSSSNNNGDEQGQNNYLGASITNAAIRRIVSDEEVTLVKIPAGGDIRPTIGLTTNDAVFEIIKGQKHFIPTVDIFFDYGFDLSVVQSITRKDLELFPRAKLVNVYDSGKDIYYITEGYMIRLIPNDRVFKSYGDREEDIIMISKKESNFYPRNQYVFLENPLSADVYQIVDDGTRRYVVPQVMKRLRIGQYQIAPINKIQLDAYKHGQPIIF